MQAALIRKQGFGVALTLAVAGGLLVPLGPAQAADRVTFASSTTAAQAAIDEAVAQGKVDSITIGLTDSRGLIWTSAAGRVDASGAAPSPTTMFGIGSVSKVITTAALMQLVEQGRIGLDQPVVKYLPRFSMRSPQYRQITVRMLLNHSAGFPGSEYSNGWTTSPFPGYAKQALNTLSQSTLKTTPGALSVYCNDCFTVAGEVVAAVSGMPFTTYVARNVFAPLGMQHSAYITNAMPATGTVARTFDGDSMRAQEVTNVYASGGVLSTPTDMGALARMFLNKGSIDATRVLSPQSVAEMGRDQIATTLMPVPDPYLVYGLGWDSVSAASLRFEGVRGWSKNGATGDYHADFLVAPDAGLAVFAAAAGEQPGIDGVVAQIAELLMINALREQGTIGARSLTVAVPALAAPTADDVNAMIGVYPAAFAGSLRVTATGDPSVLQLSKLLAGTWVPIEQVAFRADGAWWPTTSTTHSWRTTSGWGRNYLYESVHSGDQVANLIVAQRVDPSGPTTRAWNRRIGVWLLVNERADSTGWRGPALLLSRIPGLPGYLDVGGSPISAQGVVGSMFLQIPTNNGRDQDDAEPIADGMLRLGHNVLRPASTVPDLASGTNIVTVGPDGYAEWFGVRKSGRVSVDGAEAWYLYDSGMDLLTSGTGKARTVGAPSGSHLVLLGRSGQHMTVILR